MPAHYHIPTDFYPWWCSKPLSSLPLSHSFGFIRQSFFSFSRCLLMTFPPSYPLSLPSPMLMDSPSLLLIIFFFPSWHGTHIWTIFFLSYHQVQFLAKNMAFQIWSHSVVVSVFHPPKPSNVVWHSTVLHCRDRFSAEMQFNKLQMEREKGAPSSLFHDVPIVTRTHILPTPTSIYSAPPILAPTAIMPPPPPHQRLTAPSRKTPKMDHRTLRTGLTKNTYALKSLLLYFYMNKSYDRSLSARKCCCNLSNLPYSEDYSVRLNLQWTRKNLVTGRAYTELAIHTLSARYVRQ